MSTNPEISVEDAELLALMAELEEASAEITKAEEANAAPVAAEPAPAPAPAPTAIVVPDTIEAELEELEIPEIKESAVVEPVAEKAVKDRDLPTPAKTPPMSKVKEPAAELVADFSEADQDAVISADRPTSGLKFKIDAAKFIKETQVTETNLDAAMIEQSALRAYYGVQAAQAEAQAARMAMRFDVIESELNKHYRKIMTDSGEKVTEKAIETEVRLDPLWIKAKNLVIDADEIARANRNIAVSLADRKDMIMQLGFDRRDEMKGAARVLAVQQEREDFQARAANAAKGAIRLQ